MSAQVSTASKQFSSHSSHLLQVLTVFCLADNHKEATQLLFWSTCLQRTFVTLHTVIKLLTSQMACSYGTWGILCLLIVKMSLESWACKQGFCLSVCAPLSLFLPPFPSLFPLLFPLHLPPFFPPSHPHPPLSFFFLLELRTKPRSLWLLGKCSTTELNP